MFSFIKSYTQMFMTRSRFRNNVEQKHNENAIKFMKITSNQFNTTQKSEKNKKLDSQKNR